MGPRKRQILATCRNLPKGTVIFPEDIAVLGDGAIGILKSMSEAGHLLQIFTGANVAPVRGRLGTYAPSVPAVVSSPTTRLGVPIRPERMLLCEQGRPHDAEHRTLCLPDGGR